MEALEYLISAIDAKNELYINAAASKIMFLTNTSEDLEGLLNRLFKIILSINNVLTIHPSSIWLELETWMMLHYFHLVDQELTQ